MVGVHFTIDTSVTFVLERSIVLIFPTTKIDCMKKKLFSYNIKYSNYINTIKIILCDKILYFNEK